MLTHQLKNMLIGLFVVVACVLIIGIILFVKPSVGDGQQILKVRFGNINNISVGTPVTYAGKPIGEVSAIQLVPDARKQAVNEFGQVYPYVLTLKIDSSYVVFSTDEITVQTQGLLGEKYVAIIPKPLKQGQVTTIITAKDIVYAESSDLLESAMNEVSAVAQKVEEALDKVIAWVDKYGDHVGAAIISFDKAITQIGKAAQDFNDYGIMKDIKKITQNGASLFANADEIVKEMRDEEFFHHLSLSAKHIDEILATVSQGKGTLGRIIEEDGLYLQVNALMTKANTMMNDINQYGLLFQYNKQWQRNRLKLMNEANAIKDPKAFQAYMESQVDSINTTLSRMSSLTDCFDKEELANNAKFKERFNELLHEINSLQERVQIFNQELFEIRQNT